jgi:hypothetical protein
MAPRSSDEFTEKEARERFEALKPRAQNTPKPLKDKPKVKRAKAKKKPGK